MTRYEHDMLLERVNEIHDDMGKIQQQLHDLERQVWRLIGSASAAAAAFTLLAATLVYHVTHGG